MHHSRGYMTLIRLFPGYVKMITCLRWSLLGFSSNVTIFSFIIDNYPGTLRMQISCFSSNFCPNIAHSSFHGSCLPQLLPRCSFSTDFIFLSFFLHLFSEILCKEKLFLILHLFNYLCKEARIFSLFYGL